MEKIHILQKDNRYYMEQAIEKFIDIYSKLLIGVISFIAPITSYMLSTYIGDRKRILQNLTEKERQVRKILNSDLKEAINKEKDAQTFINESNNKMQEMRDSVREKQDILAYLDPKLRISTLFAWLLSSMGLLFLYIFLQGKSISSAELILIGSFGCFVVSLWNFRMSAWKLIRAKEILSEDEQEIIENSVSEPIQAEVTVKPK